MKMTIICVGTLGRQLVCLCLSSLRRGSLGDTYWAKGAPIVVCQDKENQDWLNSKVLVMKAWKGSRCKMVGLEVLLIYKRVAAWFPGPLEDAKRLFQRHRRLNRGFDKCGEFLGLLTLGLQHGVCLLYT